MILITGATGHLGGATLNALLKKAQPSEFSVLVRNAKKAEAIAAKGVEVRVGDYNNAESLDAAFKDVDKLFFVSSDDLAARMEQHANVVNAAKRAGVKHIVYTSVLKQPEDPFFTAAVDHHKTEKLIDESGISYTFLRNAFYFETLPQLLGNVMESGEIAFPAGEGRLSNASRLDMAEAAANVLTQPGHENKIYEIASSTSVSFAEIAEILSELTTEQIEYVDIPLEDFTAYLESVGLPAEVIKITAGIGNAVKHGQLGLTSLDLETLLGRKPLTIREYLKETYLDQAAATA